MEENFQRKRKQRIIDLCTFDLWLNNELYIKAKYKRNKIISLYKRFLNQNVSIKKLEYELDNLGYDEITYNNISRYILYPEYRYKENKKMEAKNGNL